MERNDLTPEELILLEETVYTPAEVQNLSVEERATLFRELRSIQLDTLVAAMGETLLSNQSSAEETGPTTPRPGPDEEEQLRKLEQEAMLKENMADTHDSPLHQGEVFGKIITSLDFFGEEEDDLDREPSSDEDTSDTDDSEYVSDADTEDNGAVEAGHKESHDEGYTDPE